MEFVFVYFLLGFVSVLALGPSLTEIFQSRGKTKKEIDFMMFILFVMWLPVIIYTFFSKRN